MPSSPGKMDLSALSGLKKRVLQPVPSAPLEAVPAEQTSETVPESEPQAVAGSQDARTAEATRNRQSGTDAESAADAGVTASDRLEGQAAHEPVEGPRPTVIAQEKIEPAGEEHSGHVTLYLPKDLNRWLGEHHDSTDISYPGIVLNAISWAAGENRFGDIFAPKDSLIPANDIFGRAPAIPKHARGSLEPETRPLRFRRDHMRVIISLARTWTADNRNAFFVGVLTAYRNHQNMS
ncbi:hypothetical protein LFT45_22720 (plasmid) [Arthrobacter sp. FW305-BF8]|uniref:hypothetical protein n=1 Tax=Arthrobacter sp. FW305-BF8 TaxID=2879617 RepID=UPI001F374E25|nr:hypothetical protein [Arthrobacter sp. FW305-BF8]UKA56733.1 hypothetical protein LFT45_22720 [Arthrobacter sp. FW305-BF8]